MSGLPTLDPEIADLGLAIGLLSAGTDGVELDSTWFDDPGERLTGVLADDDRRTALVRFADAVMAEGQHDDSGGVSRIHLFNLRTLAGDDTLPDLTVSASLDARSPDYVEVGLAVTFATTDPATSTDLTVPLYRAAKTGKSVPEPFALLAGGVIHLACDIVVSTAVPATDEFGLAGVSVGLDTALTEGAQPSFQLVLKGLHLPGATSSEDLAIGGPGQDLEQTLLSLVLGLVRQSADALAGAAGDEARAALDLLGLGDAVGIPPLPVADLLDRGVDELRDWFTGLVGAPAARDAWMGSLAGLLGGSVDSGPTGDLVRIPVPGSPVTVEIGFSAATGPSGHLIVTPRLGITLTADVAGAVRLGAEAVADVLTIDTATGALSAVPHVEVVATATGAGAGDAADLVHTGDFVVGMLRLGLAVDHGAAQALVQLRDVTLEGHPHAVVDLSTPDAVVAAAGHLAGDLIATALDGLGDAGADLKALLGLVPTGGITALDASHLLTDPLGTLADWWHDLVTNHAADLPAVLAHVRDLVAGPSQVADAIAVADPAVGPWSIPVIDHLTLDLALEDGLLVLEPVVSLVVADLGAGCTTVTTELRIRLLALDLAGRHATFPVHADLTAKMRATGGTEARLVLGPVAIAADHIGVHAGWSPEAGLAVDLAAPNLGIETDSDRIPLVIPTLDADGHLVVPDDAWHSVEALFGVLAANAPLGWFSDLVGLTGWTVTGAVHGPSLSLQQLATDPGPALSAWLGALATDADLLGTLTSTVAHLVGGSLDGRAGGFSGSGTPTDPWLASLTSDGTGPALSVWLAPHGPVLAATLAGQALTSWRPGTPGLPPDGLAQALFDEALAGEDVAALAAGRADLGTGLSALTGRWVGTDGLVAPPPDPIDALTVVRRPDLTAAQLAALDLEQLVPGGLPAGSVVVRVAITAADAPAWTPAAGRLLDLTTPGVTPAAFTVESPDSGEWVVALAPRAAATLGGVGDPTGLVGQSGRLQQVLTRLATAGPVVLVALGGAGHAARLAADAVSGVTHLVTLGTPWSPVTFDSARTGAPADALRLLRAVLPALDLAEPDDADLAVGRQLVDGFFAAARGADAVTELEAPRPTLAVRAGLTAVGVFGVLSEAAVGRAVTAVFAAGLSTRAQVRVAAASAEPESAHVAVRVPFDLLTPPGGHGVTVAGSLALSLGGVATEDLAAGAQAGLVAELTIAHTDGWLVGGPGVAPLGGALPLELRRVSARFEIGLHGGTSSAQVRLHEGSALGADFAELLAAPAGAATGELETQPILPEASAVLAALTAKLAAEAGGSPARAAAALLAALGVTQADGGLVPDALVHLLHDPGAHLRTLVGTPPSRAALLTALAGLVPGLTSSGDTLQLVAGPVSADADLAAGTVGFTAAAGDGLLAWSAGASFDSAGHPSFTIGLGDAATDPFALSVGSAPHPYAELVRPGGRPPIGLFPTLDVDGLAQLALAAIPAEAVRVLLEGLRRIDDQLALVLDALADALGMLKAADERGIRAIATPIGLFERPRPAGSARPACSPSSRAGRSTPPRSSTCFESLKPFLGFVGSPRGAVADRRRGHRHGHLGIERPDPGPGRRRHGLAGRAGRTGRVRGRRERRADPAARRCTAARLWRSSSASRTVPAARRPPSIAGPVTSPSTRVSLRVFLRPAAGSDIEIYPNTAGLGDALATGVTEVLPLALNQVAALSGDEVRTEVAGLVGSRRARSGPRARARRRCSTGRR